MIVTTLQKNETEGEVNDYFESKFSIHPKMKKQVHWESVRRVFKAQKKHRSMLSKIFHKETHTFAKSHQWGTAKTATCQLCRLKDENNDHLLTCMNVDMLRIREMNMKQLNSKLTAMKTHPTVQYAINEGIRQWTKNPSNLDLKAYDNAKEVNEVIYRQSCIGWNNFMCGILHNGWSDLQQKYAKNVEKAMPGEDWIKSVVENILLMRRELWTN